MNAIKRISLCLVLVLVCSIPVLAGETLCPPNPGEMQCPPAPCVQSALDNSATGGMSTSVAPDTTEAVITEAAIELLQSVLLVF